MNRRLLIGAAAGAAVLAGVGVALKDEGEDADDALWQHEFDRPGGGKLAMSSLRGRPLVLNFWASWCAPCVREMPQIDRFFQQQGPNGWQVIGIAIDQPEPVQAFLGKTPVAFPIAIAGFGGLELVRALGNAQGALPFTVLLGRNGRVAWRKLGETSFDELLGETAQIA